MLATSAASHSRNRIAIATPGDHMETPVREIMTPGVVSIPEDVSHLLVRRSKDAMPEGVISDLDLIALEGS